VDNEEGGEGGSVTTVTFEEKADKTLVVVREAILRRKRSTLRHGAQDAMVETFDQLDELLVAPG